MKRVLAIFVAIVAFSGMASAQTLGDFLKGAATELIDKKTDGKNHKRKNNACKHYKAKQSSDNIIEFFFLSGSKCLCHKNLTCI